VSRRGRTRAKIRRVNSSRFVCLATICAALMCLACAMQLLGINRIVGDDGRVDASTSRPAVTTLAGGVEIHFRTDGFRLDP
jgi:hypothetical protein